MPDTRREKIRSADHKVEQAQQLLREASEELWGIVHDGGDFTPREGLAVQRIDGVAVRAKQLRDQLDLAANDAVAEEV